MVHRIQSQNGSQPMRMTARVYQQIRSTVGTYPAETGGILGGSYHDGIVTHFTFDAQAQTSGVSYSPNTEILTGLLKTWNAQGIRMLGMVHSHPRQVTTPSGADLVYARQILEANQDLRESSKRLLLPIVLSAGDGRSFKLLAFAATLHDDTLRTERVSLEIVDDTGVGSPQTPNPPRDLPTVTFDAVDGADLAATFSRVRTACDISRLCVSRIVIVGTGGARSFVEDLARAGVGEFVLIDPDTVTHSNLATQHAYRHELGRPKVDCIAECIRDINPLAAVIPLPVKLDDIHDQEFARLAFEPLRRWNTNASSLWGIPGNNVQVDVSIRPVVTLLCGTTDDFFAQAHINRLALHFGLPSLCAQMYREGQAAEITFTYPGVTPACHRCILRDRYSAYYDGGFKNDTTSDGTPIFATARLNAISGFVSQGLLHVASGHPRWDSVLQRIGNRNLVQIRMDPEAPLPVFNRVLAGAERDRIFCDETVWLAQVPDPDCPDCRGKGDLRIVRGSFHDTCDQHMARQSDGTSRSD